MLGVGFSLQTDFDFLTSHFGRDFYIIRVDGIVLSLDLKRCFTCDHFRKVMGV